MPLIPYTVSPWKTEPTKPVRETYTQYRGLVDDESPVDDVITPEWLRKQSAKVFDVLKNSGAYPELRIVGVLAEHSYDPADGLEYRVVYEFRDSPVAHDERLAVYDVHKNIYDKWYEAHKAAVDQWRAADDQVRNDQERQKAVRAASRNLREHRKQQNHSLASIKKILVDFPELDVDTHANKK